MNRSVATVGRLQKFFDHRNSKSCGIIFSAGSFAARTIRVRRNPCLKVCNGVTCHPLTKSCRHSLPIASGNPEIPNRFLRNCPAFSAWICVRIFGNPPFSHGPQIRAQKEPVRRPFRRRKLLGDRYFPMICRLADVRLDGSNGLGRGPPIRCFAVVPLRSSSTA